MMTSSRSRGLSQAAGNRFADSPAACVPAASVESFPVVWAGLDVAKETFEAALNLRAGSAGSIRPLAGMPGRGFGRTRLGAAQFAAWALPQLPAGARLGVVMEATGR